MPQTAATLAANHHRRYIAHMDTINPAPNDSAGAPSPESEAERRRQIAWEAERIAEARAELDAGLFVDAAEVDTWIDSIGTDHELPPPATRHR